VPSEPARIGDGAYLGSGNVIGKDVPDNALAVTRSPVVVTKEDWASRMRARQEAAKQAAKGDKAKG
jgi:bifunctional UDP-N-acetylglucosamine pyrophosphorylase / glucosamine-1-phosphate N-acetyltransferase